MTTAGMPLRLAHRGDWRRAPENTIAAFAAAVAKPACDGVEFDVRMSRDGVPVICHDATLARTHGRPDRVDAMTAGDLATFGVPSLEEVIGSVGPHTFLDVELKVDIGPECASVVSATRGSGFERSVVSSFIPSVLERVAHLAPRWPRWFVADRLDPASIRTATELDCRAVAVGWQSIDARSTQAARAAGLEVVAWTVRRRPTFDRLARLGVSAVCVEGRPLDAEGSEA